MEKESFKTFAADALQYWESRRILYNVVLAIIVITYFCLGLPASMEAVSVDVILQVTLLAVIANVLFCAAYIPDIFVQLSGLDPMKKHVRLVVFSTGLLFAGIITRFVSMGMLLGI